MGKMNFINIYEMVSGKQYLKSLTFIAIENVNLVVHK